MKDSKTTQTKLDNSAVKNKVSNKIKHKTSTRGFTKRHWLAFEKNHLLKHGIGLDDLEQYGQMPVEYISGWAEFMGHQFELSPEVLIPRVETEKFVELAVVLWQQELGSKPDLNLADVGTGSGAIGICFLLELAERLPVAKPTAFLTDLSQEAVKIAKKNYQRLVPDKLKSQFQAKFVVSDLMTDFPVNLEIKFDLILANLPYIPSGRLDKLEASVINYEPRVALEGGVDGFELIRKFLDQVQAGQWLAPGGLVLLEVDEQVEISRQSLNLTDQVKMEVLPDQYYNQRFIILRF
ncbi:MAG: HemK family protein methyltransferase [Candidatus Pacebacteria bacterium]|nr:HemK family protein methyltransferase [Candidatus Paceibacterota bacterium]